MSISSNSVIHFTSKIENIKGILKEGFKVKYCLEETKLCSGKISAAFPMVSFCDIPLSEIKNHISNYGSYAIGLKKEWAVQNRLNPVLYIDFNSYVGESIRESLMEFTKLNDRKKHTLKQLQLIDVARYIKNYQRDLERNGTIIKDYRFYDEREWRFVPDLNQTPILISAKSYRDTATKNQKNEDIGKIKLTFDASDISYIVLKEESEISPFIPFLRECFKRSTLEDFDKLITRIITTNQINEDF